MIEATKAYKTSDGMTFPTLEGAQSHALVGILEKSLKPGTAMSAESVGLAILDSKEEIIAILKLKPRKSKVAKPAKTPKKQAKGKGASSVPNPLTADLTKT